MIIPPELAPPTRVLLGPGPSDVDSRVLRAMATPLLGHLDPEFLKTFQCFVRYEVVMNVQPLQFRYSGRCRQRRRANIAQRSQRKVKNFEPIQDWRVSDVCRQGIGIEVVPQSQITKARK